MLRLLVVLGIVGAVLFLFVRAYAHRAADRAYDQLLSASALAIADAVQVEEGAITVDLPYSSLSILGMARRDRVFYKIVAPGGALLTGYGDLPAKPAHGGESGPVFSDAVYRGVPVRVAVLGRLIVRPDVTGPVTIVVAQTREARDALAQEIFANAFAPILLAVLAGAALLWFGVRQALEPLGYLERLIRARRPNDFSPIDVPAPAEVSQLLGAINHLMGRLKANLDQTKTFLADAAHQIRTPLAALRAQAEIAAEETETDRLRRIVGRVHRNAVEVSELTTQLLSHAMVLHRGEAVQRETVDLAALIGQVVHRAEAVAEGTPIRIVQEGQATSFLVSGDPVSLREALANLLDNAVKYGGGPAGVEVRLRPGGHGHGPVVEIADHGPGIPDTEKPVVLRRFGRGSAAAGTVGSGLGLAIVEAVAEAHDAAFSLHDRPDGGLLARLAFPPPQEGAKAGAKAALLPLVLAMLLALWPGVGWADEITLFPALGPEAERLRIHTATDRPQMEVLIHDFQQANPNVAIHYVQMTNTELYDSVVAPTGEAPDLLISSSADLQAKLVNDGFAKPYVSAYTAALPDWANWRDEAFGFTLEPAVIVYNRTLVPEAEVPHSRDALIRLLRDQEERYRGRVVTYDLAQRGIGYLFAAQDSVLSSQFWQLADTLGDVGVRVACCTADMLDAIERGDALIGYNLLGTYARVRQIAGAPIGIVAPSDYTLVAMRVATIHKDARSPQLAGRFIDYLLSERGQGVIAKGDAFYALSPTAEGPMSAAHLLEGLSGPVQRIALGPALLVFLDDLKHERFLRHWQRVVQRP
ncbi:sensor histidine kinase [Azospirillum sp. sgz302134]